MGWQKRGSGRSYNSHSGVCTAVGGYTRKVVHVDVKRRWCTKCRQKVDCEKKLPKLKKKLNSAVNDWTNENEIYLKLVL